MNGGHKNSEDDYYDYMDMFDEEDYYNYGAGINWIISQRTDAPQGSILVYLINLYRNSIQKDFFVRSKIVLEWF